MKSKKTKQEIETEMRGIAENVVKWSNGNSAYRGLVLAMVDSSTGKHLIATTAVGEWTCVLTAANEMLEHPTVKKLLRINALFGEDKDED